MGIHWLFDMICAFILTMPSIAIVIFQIVLIISSALIGETSYEDLIDKHNDRKQTVLEVMSMRDFGRNVIQVVIVMMCRYLEWEANQLITVFFLSLQLCFSPLYSSIHRLKLS